MTGRRARWTTGTILCRFITVAGLIVLALLAVVGGPHLVAEIDVWLVVLVGCVLLGELHVAVRSAPVRLEISTGGVFAFALLVTYGTTPAALAMATASLLGDVVQRKPARVACMNVGLWTLTCAAAGLALHAANGLLPVTVSGAVDVPGAACAGIAFCAVNFGLIMSWAAMESGRPVSRVIRDEIWRGASEDAAGLSVATVICLAGQRPWTLPLLVLPFILAQGGRQIAVTERQAMRDPLTDLPNRALLLDRASQALRRANREGTSGAVLLVDLDGFKAVNDLLGHHVGDALLRQVADRLTGCVRATDTVARLGGDEFALVLDVTDNPAQAAREVRENIANAIDDPFVIDRKICQIGASVGIACFTADADGVQAIIERADAAMYEHKAARKTLRTQLERRHELQLPRSH